MTNIYTLKMKGIKNLDIYNDNRLDISKIGNFYGRETTKIKFSNDNELSFESGSLYFDDIFKEISLMNKRLMFCVKQVGDEDFDNELFSFYKDGKFILSLLINHQKPQIKYNKIERYDIADIKSEEDFRRMNFNDFHLQLKEINLEKFLSYFDDNDKWIIDGIIK